MGKLKLKKGIAYFAVLALLLSTAPSMPLLAASGSISIKPQSDGRFVDGCEFDLYQVATYDAVLSGDATFTLTNDFQGANVNINSIKTASQQEAAAEALLPLVRGAAAYSGTKTNGGNMFKAVPLGAYLIVQTAAPAGYQASNAFMIFLPSSKEGDLVTAINARPKLKYSPAGEDEISLSTNIVWEDSNYAGRPSSVKVGLFNGEVLVSSAELSSANNWVYQWTGLIAGNNWDIRGIDVPEGYTSAVSSKDGVYTIKNTRSPVVNGSLAVTKVWVNDSKHVRPTSVEITLLCNGKAYDCVTLNAANNWSYEWTGLDEGGAWTVEETSVHEHYTAGITMAEGGYIISNTYSLQMSDSKLEEEYTPAGSGYFGETGTPTGINDSAIFIAIADSSGGNTHTNNVSQHMDTLHPQHDSNAPASGGSVDENKGSAPSGMSNKEKPENIGLAPQTGLVRRPIPVLVITGFALLICSCITEWKRKYA